MLYEVITFLVSLGKRGLVELARLNRDKAEYAKRALAAVRGVTIPFGGPTFNEFSIVITSYSIHYTKLYENPFPAVVHVTGYSFKTPERAIVCEGSHVQKAVCAGLTGYSGLSLPRYRIDRTQFQRSDPVLPHPIEV